VFIPAITKQACRARDRAGDQDHLSIQPIIVGWLGVAPSRLDHQGTCLLCRSSKPDLHSGVDQAKE
jgi:hypothetical protein